MRTVLVHVFRKASGSDSSANGLTSKVTYGLLFSADSTQEEIETYCKKSKCDPKDQFKVVDRKSSVYRNYAEPVVKPVGKHQMFGGNFLYTSDSNFSEITGSNAPISVHDRFEEYHD